MGLPRTVLLWIRLLVMAWIATLPHGAARSLRSCQTWTSLQLGALLSQRKESFPARTPRHASGSPTAVLSVAPNAMALHVDQFQTWVTDLLQIPRQGLDATRLDPTVSYASQKMGTGTNLPCVTQNTVLL